MLRIDTVQPTVLFVTEQDSLLQRFDLSVSGAEAVSGADIGIVFRAAGVEPRTCFAGRMGADTNTLPVHVPDLRQPGPVEFSLLVDGEVRDRRSLDHTPGKHWRVHLVPIAHHDLGYTDTIEGVLGKYRAIYRDVLQFCHETEDWPEECRFRYTAEEAWSIQHFADTCSREEAAQLARYAGEGRIEIPGLYGNQISGLCSHEELIRLMYPSFRLGRELGASIRAASITDVPGLSWGLPTVLAGAGVRYFFAGLPTYFRWANEHVAPDIHTFWDEESVIREHGPPDAFRWQGPDGSSVLVYYQGGYGCWGPLCYGDALEQLPGMLDEMDAAGSPFSVVRYGGYGCGDNTGTDLAVSHVVREWNEQWAFPRLVVSTNSMFFSELEEQCAQVRTFSGELPDTDYVVGAVSSARETGVNRRSHDKLHAAEKLATIASFLNGDPEMVAGVRQAYESMLLYDEHTWGKSYQVGASQDFAWNEKSQYAWRAAAMAESILATGTGSIAGSIHVGDEGRHVVVFNALSTVRTDLVRLSGFQLDAPFDLIDVESGESIPYQLLELAGPQAPVPHAAGRYARGQFSPSECLDLVFVARDVPSLGYRTYRLVARAQDPASHSDLTAGEHSLENRFYRISLDPQTGTVASIYDKELGWELVDGEARHGFNQLVMKWSRSGDLASPAEACVEVGAAGPVCASLKASSAVVGCPQVTWEITLYDGIKRIDLANRVLKDSTPNMEAYFAFPFKADDPEFRYEGSNSVIEPLRDQFAGSNSNYYPVQHWAEVRDGDRGVVLAPLEAHLLEFGGLWPCYVSQAHHGVTPSDFGRDFASRDDMRKGHVYSFVLDSNFRTNFQAVQQGDLLFRYSLTTHSGDWRQGRPRDFGWGTGNPLTAVMREGDGDGQLPACTSFCRVDQPNVMLSAMKRAERGDGLILRLTETGGIGCTVTVDLPHFEVERAFRTNLVEADEVPIAAGRHGVSLPVEAFGIVTARLHIR